MLTFYNLMSFILGVKTFFREVLRLHETPTGIHSTKKIFLPPKLSTPPPPFILELSMPIDPSFPHQIHSKYNYQICIFCYWHPYHDIPTLPSPIPSLVALSLLHPALSTISALSSLLCFLRNYEVLCLFLFLQSLLAVAV